MELLRNIIDTLLDGEEYIFLAIAMVLTVIFICFIYNLDYWQGYRNSKFLDDLYAGKYRPERPGEDEDKKGIEKGGEHDR